MGQADETSNYIPSPLRLFLSILAIIFLVEAAVMLLLPVLLGGGHKAAEPLVDAALLIVLSGPFLWWSVVRPLRRTALAEHARAATLVANARDGIITVNDEGRVHTFNPAAERIFGHQAEEVLGRLVTLLVPERYRDEKRRGLETVRTSSAPGQSGKSTELHGLRKDGKEFPMELSVTTWKVREGAFHTAIVRDITERKQAEEVLRTRTSQLEAVRAVAAEITRELDLTKVLDLITQRAAELLRVVSGCVLLWDEQTQQLSARSTHGLAEWMRGMSVKLGEGITGTVARQRQGMIVHDYSASPNALPQVSHRLGTSALLVQPLLYRDRLLGVIALSNRGTERTFTEQDLEILDLLGVQAAIAIENARLYEDVKGLATVQERERIAREMHDGLAQALAFLYLKIQRAHEAAAAEQNLHSMQSLQELIEITERVHDEVRQAIFGLRSMVARGLGLIPTLTEYLHQFRSRNGIPVTLEVPEDRPVHLPPATEVQLLRIIQEALANVLKHAQASQAWIRIRWQDSCIQAVIQDDGRGFDQEMLASPDRCHFGLQTMRERAEALGGTLEIETAPKRGTRIVATLPGGT